MNRSMILAEWNRARESLRAAETLTREALYADAISRAYYAILHGAKAGLQVHDIAAESHPAVRRMFGLHLVKPGEIEPEWSAYLTESLDDRLTADYDAETSFSKQEARSECRRSREFLGRVRRYLLKKGLKDAELRRESTVERNRRRSQRTQRNFFVTIYVLCGGQVMNHHVNAIAGRLSLRPPQRHSLEILDRITEIVPPKKGADVAAALAAIRSEYPTVTDFEREFPSLCFAIATGVGKTRLMGAFISYLHLAHGINNFFVLAPNLTIYNKLIADFTPGTPKYVFKGIAEFATDAPEIITGDNYESRARTLFDELIRCKVNIFKSPRSTRKFAAVNRRGSNDCRNTSVKVTSIIWPGCLTSSC